MRKHLLVLCKCSPSPCRHILREVSLGTASLLMACTEKRGSRRKRLTAQLYCKDFWKEPSARRALASSRVSLQQPPFAAFFPHAALTLIKLLYLAPGRFCVSLSWDLFVFKQNSAGSSGEVLTWESWNCSYFHRASMAC